MLVRDVKTVTVSVISGTHIFIFYLSFPCEAVKIQLRYFICISHRI